VEVVTIGYDVRGLNKVSTESAEAVAVEYIAGYRKEGDDLPAVQAEVSEVTVLPPVLPHDIQGVCIRLVLHRLLEAKDGLTGRTEKTETIGSQSTATKAMDRQYIQDQLDSISRHRRRVSYGG
jgi:hypothetical protein